MGRTAAYSVKLTDGREVGFGLIRRGKSKVYSVQFADPAGKGYVFRSTSQTARPAAIASAEAIVMEHYRPAREDLPVLTWDGVVAELKRHMQADDARPATIDDYLDTLRQVRHSAPFPADVSRESAQRWCNEYLTGTYRRGNDAEAQTYTRSPQTVHARIRKLKAIWGKYLIRRLKAVGHNPWAEIDLPRLNKSSIRTIAADVVQEFFAWVAARWQGWELPKLFWEVKAVTGCRLGDLAALLTVDLQPGMIVFQATNTKGRAHRVAVLPGDLCDRLRAVAGPTYLWERYASELPDYLKLRGVPTHRVNSEFMPKRLVWWAKDEIDDFNKSRPERPKIRSHDFRKRAITEAHRAGLDVDTAAAGMGMSVATARGYYLAIDQEEAAATVSARLATTLGPSRKKSAGSEPAASA